MTKLRKLVTGATKLETHIQRHRVKARDSDYVSLPLHVAFGGQRWQWWWRWFSAKLE